MASQPTRAPDSEKSSRRARLLKRHLPFLDWLPRYAAENLSGDLTAGLVVAIVLVPQSMAYALLVGLPPQMGLYASIVPLALYGLLGTSRALSVGPAAIIALLTANGVAQLAPQGGPDYLSLVLLLAFMAGCLQLILGFARLGFVVNFLSHPVISGFTSAAALVIILGQLKNLLGIELGGTGPAYEELARLARRVSSVNPVTAGIGLGSVVLLLYVKAFLPGHLRWLRVPPAAASSVVRTGPILATAIGGALVWGLRLDEQTGVAVVGAVPAGLPPLTWPDLNLEALTALVPAALTISLIGFMESVAIAKSLAIRRRQKIDIDQELVALGAANLGAAFTSGFPVAGGLSRSIVNFSAGANSGLASIAAAALVALTVVFLVPLAYYLPYATLAAIIVVGAADLVDLASLRRVWRYDKADAAALLITFWVVLGVGIEAGALAGAATAVALYLWRTSRPQIAIVGRVGESEQFRNVARFRVTTDPQVLAVRVDESLYFANTRYLEDALLRMVADHPQARRLVLICSGINYIDASGLETLENLNEELKAAGVSFYLAEVKGPVLERLRRGEFLKRLGEERVFVSAHLAMRALTRGEAPEIRYETIMIPKAIKPQDGDAKID